MEVCGGVGGVCRCSGLVWVLKPSASQCWVKVNPGVVKAVNRV